MQTPKTLSPQFPFTPATVPGPGSRYVMHLVKGVPSPLDEDQLPEGTLCPICLSVPFPYPVGCKNGHGYCRDCITKWTTHNKTCPCCKESLGTSTHPIVLSQNMTNRIMGVVYKCTSGCDFVGTRKDLKIHLQKTCTNVVFACGVPGCGFRGNREAIKTHITRCPHIHFECPNQDCHTCHRLVDMEKHLKICKFQPVTCPIPGCGQMVARHMLQKHLKQNATRHQRLLLSACGSRDMMPGGNVERCVNSLGGAVETTGLPDELASAQGVAQEVPQDVVGTKRSVRGWE